jgi:uncharacterized heparinase superfamily protein
MLGPAHFRFLNEEHRLSFPGDWAAPGRSKLWLYNLHYFDDFNAEGADGRRAWHEPLLARWIAENPPLVGSGWEPYPLSLRIVNWIKWAWAGNQLNSAALQSLAVQVRLLRRSLEFHLLGNHLFANAKAMVFAGLFFRGEEAETWLAEGSRLLARQLCEQVLDDGGHFELSPMYHALILEDLLDLINLRRAYGLEAPDSWPGVIDRMFDWLRTMCHPDGDIAFFNDAALGVAPKLVDLERYAAALGVAHGCLRTGSRLLQSSGYARLEQPEAVLLTDVAAVGPDHLPAHGHADSLSFELSVRGRRVLVNSGTSVYGVSAERLRQRGTAAHNTVRLDSADSSEVWSGFRVARRARVRLQRFDAAAGPVLDAVHDGYRRLDGQPQHRRVWTMGPGRLQIEDVIEGGGEHLVEVFVHFHPELQVRASGPDAFSGAHADGPAMLELHVDGRAVWHLEPSSWHPRFGVSMTSVRLRGEYRARLPVRLCTRLEWKV